MLFFTLAQTLDFLESTTSRLEMTELLANLFQKATPTEIKNICYLLQGRVTPLYKKQEFGMAERLVLKAFVSAFSLSIQEARSRYKTFGDIGKTAEEYRKTSQSLFQTADDLDISQVFNQLITLSLLEGPGSQEKKMAITTNLLQSLRPVSVRFLTRMLVGKLRLGFSEMTLLDAFSWMLVGDKSLRKQIEQAYNVFPDIGYIGQQLRADGIKSLNKIEPVIGIPILMAKAERVATPEEIIEKIGECAVEPKFDGFRLQLHKNYENITIYSRNLENITFMYPDLVEAMKTEVSVDRVIIEGEAVGYNRETQEFLPFQETAQRKRKYEIQKYSKAIPLKLFVFDLLYINNQSYIHKEYTERKAKLESVIKNTTLTITVAKEQIIKQPQELVALFEKATKEGLEGVIAKKLTGPYQAGARAWNWIKFKHSYSSKLNDTIDCLVMGYDYGKGKRTAFGIGAFLVGVYNQDKDEFVTVAKIGTGLTDNEWRRIKKEGFENRTETQPANYIVNKQMEVDVWINPKIVVEIRADEVSNSTVHTAGYALRFPRLEKFRADKKPNDVTTLKEVISMLKAQKRLSV